MDSKISQFVSQTGADAAVAKDLLHEKNWDVDAAVKVYRFMYNAMPPPGPQKNVEKQAHQVSGGGMPPASVKVTGPPSKNDPKPGSTQSSSKPAGLKRGISKTTENVEIVTKARDHILHDIGEQDEFQQYCLETPEYAFILPDLAKYSEDFRAFLHKDLIETSTLVSLEQAGRLNWWADLGASQRLWPLATTGDGNCLLHAASLAMWGFHDRMLTLRKTLFKAMSSTVTNSGLYRRWRWQQSQVNKETGLLYTEDEWRTEWTNLLKLASTQPRTLPTGASSGGGATTAAATSCCESPATKGMMERNAADDGDVFYESLEEFHVFLLANVLRRPIIVVADNMLKDSNGEALAPIPFGGIYLPLDCDPARCHRVPLLLTYDASHFSALVAMETETSPDDKTALPAAIPLVDPGFQLLPMHYHVDPGETFWWKNVHNPVMCDKLHMSREQKLNLIKKFVSVELLPINPPGWNSTDSEAGSEPRSRAGSVDSNAEETQNGKEKEKSKAAKQLHSVQKAFGSIGKSMSKKLKKNFGSVGRGLKENSTSSGGGAEKTRRPSVGSVTQSTKVSSITMEALRERDRDQQTILAVRLSAKRPAYQEDMVKNYLTSAQHRFQQNRELRRQHDQEMKKRTAELHAVSLRGGGGGVDVTDAGPREMACINAGCEQRGTAATSWLCPACFEKEKAQAINIATNGGSSSSSSGSHNVNSSNNYTTTVVVTSKPPPYQRPPSIGDVDRQSTLTQTGKSKFYTYANEDHAVLAKDSGLASHNTDLNNVKRQSAMSGGGKVRSDNVKSTFYVENVNINVDPTAAAHPRPVSHVVTAKPPVNLHRGGGGATHGQLPPGTAYIMNDLHREEKLSNKEKSATLPSRGSKNMGGGGGVGYSGEPPLRPEFGGPPLRPMSAAGMAGTLQGSADNVYRLTAAVSGSQGSAGLGMQKRCRTPACDFYGSEATDFYCSSCWKDRQRTLSHQAQRK